MKEYSLGEVIDKFSRNPNLKFKFVAEELYKLSKGVIVKLDKVGRVVNEEGEPILSNFSLNSKFSLVNEPVDKLEAFKAFSMGKTIYCSHANNKYEYIPCHDSEFTALKNKFDEPISIEEILYGEWFIEED
ncbi:hypothetical protein [Clostridium tyrobutyricum]|uniref:hypothetical protein n=1 Tax=Clostridium tyrobutyricum TaxID=1519 RepID=UPI00073D851D|nr:hypothetical protein [Clostridium tyrobutyricum]